MPLRIPPIFHLVPVLRRQRHGQMAQVLGQKLLGPPADQHHVQVLPGRQPAEQIHHLRQDLPGRFRLLQGIVQVEDHRLEPGGARREAAGDGRGQGRDAPGTGEELGGGGHGVEGAEELVGPGDGVVGTEELPHLGGQLLALLHAQLQSLPDSLRHLIVVIRVHKQRVEHLRRGPRKSRKHHCPRDGIPVFRVLARDVLLGYQVHPVYQWGNQAHVCSGVEGDELGGGHGAVDIHEGDVERGGELPVGNGHLLVDVLLNGSVLVHVQSAGDGDEQKNRVLRRPHGLLRPPEKPLG
mmetsp:Transcript_39243/g.85569  ORF Transcript_39243/g.85569 Transcript_39243/m.85569 type:complete len:295 (-) Transcript_39243:1016-1900(-)